MAIHYAHLVMLADRGIVTGDDARTLRDGARLDLAERHPVHAVRRHLRGPVLLHRAAAGQGVRRGRRRPPAHRAQPQRHRHDDVPDAAARVHRGALAASLELQGRPDRARVAAPRHDLRRAHAHAAGAAVDDRALPARGRSSSSSATPTAPAGRLRLARTGTRSARARSPAPASRSIAHLTSDLLGFDGPTGNTYGSIATVDYLLESVSAASVLLAGLGRVRAGPAALVHDGVRLPAARRTASCSRAASCRRSATPSRSSTRAPSAARRSGRRRPSSLAVHNTPFGDIVDTEDDLQPLVASMFRDALRAVTPGGRRDARRRRSTSARLESRAGGRRHDADRARRSSRARARDSVQDGARHRRPPAEGASRAARTRRSERCWRRCRATCSACRCTYTDAQIAEIMSPRHFVEVRRTLGGPAPDETARALTGLARAARARRGLAGADPRGAWRCRRRAAPRPEPGAVKAAYIRVLLDRGGRPRRRSGGCSTPSL